MTFFWFLDTIFYPVPIHPSTFIPGSLCYLQALSYSYLFPLYKKIPFYFFFVLIILLVLMFQTLSRYLPYAAIFSWLMSRSNYNFCIVIFDKFFSKRCLFSTSLGTYVKDINTIKNRSCEKEPTEMSLFLRALLRLALHLQKGFSSK